MVVYVGIGIFGYNFFEIWFEMFVLSMGYWFLIYVVIVLVEYFLFCGGLCGFLGYDVGDIYKLEFLLLGFVVIVFCLVGVVGVVLGMF